MHVVNFSVSVLRKCWRDLVSRLGASPSGAVAVFPEQINSPLAQREVACNGGWFPDYRGLLLVTTIIRHKVHNALMTVHHVSGTLPANCVHWKVFILAIGVHVSRKQDNHFRNLTISRC